MKKLRKNFLRRKKYDIIIFNIDNYYLMKDMGLLYYKWK